MPAFPPAREPDEKEHEYEKRVRNWWVSIRVLYGGGFVFLILFSIWFYLTYGWSAI